MNSNPDNSTDAGNDRNQDAERAALASRERVMKNSRLKLIGVIAAFSIPLLLATLWLQYVRTTGGSLGISVRGELIHPAYPLETLELAELKGDESDLFDDESLRGIWTMFYAPQGSCDEVCEKNLYHMRQVRLALNHRMDRVQRVLLVTDLAQVPAELLSEHPGLRVVQGSDQQYIAMIEKINAALTASEGKLSNTAPGGEEAIYLIDPFANLMMRFRADLPPKSMLKDIKHLLKVSRIG